MVQKCPRCGVQYTREALQMLETTVKAGIKINLTCGNCGASMVIDESRLPSQVRWLRRRPRRRNGGSSGSKQCRASASTFAFSS